MERLLAKQGKVLAEASANQAKEQDRKMDLMRAETETNAEANREEMETVRAEMEKMRVELEKQREENKEMMRMLKHLVAVAANTGEK